MSRHLAPRARRAMPPLLGEAALSTLAFGIIIGVQQILILPGISRMTSAVGFSDVILVITVSTILVNVIGTEAAKVSLVRADAYRREGLPWDTPRIALGGALLALLGAVAAALVGAVAVPVALAWAAITVLGIVRSYGTAPDRFQGAFGRVVLVHGAYAVGAAAGLLLVPSTDLALLPFVAGEALSVLVLVGVRLRHRTPALTLRRTSGLAQTRRVFWAFGAVALLTNAVTYLDRLTITPLIGAGALAVYYSATALSSSLSLLTNPVGAAVLARLSRSGDAPAQRQALLRRGLLLAIPLVLVFWVASLVIAVAGLVVLYPAHLQAALPLLLPVSLAAALSSTITLVAPLVQRFVPARLLLRNYIVHALTYTTALLVMSSLWGLVGFAAASAVASSVLLTLHLLRIRRAGLDAGPMDPPGGGSPPVPAADAEPAPAPGTAAAAAAEVPEPGTAAVPATLSRTPVERR